MAKETLLDRDISAGAKLIRALDGRGIAITAGMWFFYPDLGDWKLLLVSPQLTEEHLPAAYTKISEAISGDSEIAESLSISDVKVLTNKDPMIRMLRGVIRTDRGISTIRMTSNLINGIYVEDALIYRNAA
jgi:hypothetical protein